MKMIDMPGSANSPRDVSLRGCRILVVEDEILIALTAQDFLTDAGADVAIATRMSEAADRLCGSDPFDAAIIDLNLGDGYDFSLAAKAVGRGIPVVFATGYSGVLDVPPAFTGIPIVSKPYTGNDLVSTLKTAIGPRTDAG